MAAATLATVPLAERLTAALRSVMVFAATTDDGPGARSSVQFTFYGDHLTVSAANVDGAASARVDGVCDTGARPVAVHRLDADLIAVALEDKDGFPAVITVLDEPDRLRVTAGEYSVTVPLEPEGVPGVDAMIDDADNTSASRTSVVPGRMLWAITEAHPVDPEQMFRVRAAGRHLPLVVSVGEQWRAIVFPPSQLD